MKNHSNILHKPHITEKATASSEQNIFVFKIAKNATKNDVTKAVKELYKVNPLKVSTVTIPAKRVFVRGKRGMKSGYKKAYIYLDKKDKIEII
jgi:large subunit ribosomal protein L23